MNEKKRPARTLSEMIQDEREEQAGQDAQRDDHVVAHIDPVGHQHGRAGALPHPGLIQREEQLAHYREYGHVYGHRSGHHPLLMGEKMLHSRDQHLRPGEEYQHREYLGGYRFRLGIAVDIFLVGTPAHDPGRHYHHYGHSHIRRGIDTVADHRETPAYQTGHDLGHRQQTVADDTDIRRRQYLPLHRFMTVLSHILFPSPQIYSTCRTNPKPRI